VHCPNSFASRRNLLRYLIRTYYIEKIKDGSAINIYTFKAQFKAHRPLLSCRRSWTWFSDQSKPSFITCTFDPCLVHDFTLRNTGFSLFTPRMLYPNFFILMLSDSQAKISLSNRVRSLSTPITGRYTKRSRDNWAWVSRGEPRTRFSSSHCELPCGIDYDDQMRIHLPLG
jgi:hypothetical protein